MIHSGFSTWGQWVPGNEEIDLQELPTEFSTHRPLKAFMGWDGLFVHDPAVNLVDMARAYMAEAYRQSCGRCTPCRLGLGRISAILEAICEGKGRRDDLERLEQLALLVSETSRCDIGQTTPRPLLDLLRLHRDDFATVIDNAEPVAKSHYVSQVTAPCINACPSHVDIPAYVEKIHDGLWTEALDIINSDCCLPGVVGRVCVRPCEFNCRRQRLDEGIAIRALKRFAADTTLARGPAIPLAPGPDKGHKVAIIGAGPAGLACAYYLGRAGYRTTIFEMLDEPGGMAAVGIPDYRLPREILRGEARQVEKLGGEIRYGVHVGKDITFQDLMVQGYEALFVGVGAPEASSMRCEGEDQGYECFMTGVAFLKSVADGQRPIEGKKLLVVGGGNVAMDCVRSAVRLGFTDVNLLYRRTAAEMPADPQEVKEAMEEGIIFHYLVAPQRILAENGKVTGLECLKMELGEPDASGRRRPVIIDGSNFVIECDAIVPAIGQTCVVDCLLPSDDVDLTNYRSVVVDEITGRSNQPHIFAGGDCVTGPATLIAALAAGKNAARYIDGFLTDGKTEPQDRDYMDRLIARLGVYSHNEKMPFAGGTRKLEPPVLPAEERVKTFDEVEACANYAEAVQEAGRCLRCYRVGMAVV